MTEPESPGSPPGTVVLRFWQRAGTRTAIGTTAIVALGFLTRWVSTNLGTEYAVALDLVAGSWFVALGINVVSPGAIRRV